MFRKDTFNFVFEKLLVDNDSEIQFHLTEIQLQESEINLQQSEIQLQQSEIQLQESEPTGSLHAKSEYIS